MPVNVQALLKTLSFVAGEVSKEVDVEALRAHSASLQDVIDNADLVFPNDDLFRAGAVALLGAIQRLHPPQSKAV